MITGIIKKHLLKNVIKMQKHVLKHLKILLGLVVLMIGMSSSTDVLNAQIKIVPTQKSDSLIVQWSCSWIDVNGSPEHVIRFDCYIAVDDSNFIYYGSTADDNQTYRPPTQFSFSNLENNHKYAFGVKAVDWADLQSAMHTSLDSTAAFGGWYVITDFVPPSFPFGIRP